MSTLAERTKSARKEAGLSQKDLAKAIGTGQSTIASIENGRNQSSGLLVPIAKVLGLRAEWLATGKGLMREGAYNKPEPGTIHTLREPETTYNTSAGPSIQGSVPLITSIQAGEWAEIAATLRPQDAELWLPCPVKHGSMTFCLRVEGESMRNPGARPSYEPGDIIFVDPGLCAMPGDRVVVKLDDQNKATFKQYMEEDGRKLLKALNPDWKPRYLEINGNATICGVVIGKWVSE